MSRADFDKWASRYGSGRGYGSSPDRWLTEVASGFLPATGTAVDLAGGSGRHARWLAGLGLETLHLQEGWGPEGRHEVRYVGRLSASS